MKSNNALTSDLLEKLAAVAVTAGIVLATTVLFAPQAHAQIKVKMATLVPNGSSWYLIFKEAADKWKKVSNGKVIVNIYPGGVVGDDPEIVRKMRLGTLHAGVLTTVGVAEIDKSVYALGVPMMYGSYEEVYAVFEKMRPTLEANIAKQGFVVLNWADGGWVHFFSQRPVATPDDLKKLKLCAWDNDTDMIDIMKSLGFNLVPQPATEIVTALQTDLVNAVTISPQLAIITQYFHYAKYMTDLNWELLLGAAVIDKRVWDRIPTDLHAPLMQVMQEAGKKLQDVIRKEDVTAVKVMKDRGLNVVPVDAGARDAWVKLAESAYLRIRGRIVPAGAFDEALKYRDELRKSTGAAK